jgi:ribosomal protein L7Ae-like RNA K-turn-binding protein
LNNEKVTALLRLAQKGRMVEVGKTAVSVLLKRNRASLVMLAADASEKVKHAIEKECNKKNIPIFIFSTKDDLGALFGRDTVGTIAISDRNMAHGIKKILNSP